MKTRLLKSLCLIVLGLLCAINLFGQTTTHLNPVKDNSIFSENNNSNGTGELYSGRTGVLNGNNFRRALMEFDLSSLPNDATITNATLTVNVIDRGPGSSNENYKIYQVTREWGEGTSFSPNGQGVPAIAPDATWNYAMYNTINWTTAGGDRSVTQLSSVNFTLATGNYIFPTSVNFVSTVQAWLDNPASNHGLILIGDESKSNSVRKIDSRETVSGTAPILSLTYNTLGIDDFSIKKFTISPNPSNSELKLELPESVSLASVKVFDILGKEVYSNSEYRSPINVSSWEKGIYLVQVKNSQNIQTKKFIKN